MKNFRIFIQIGFPDANQDDFLANNDMNSCPILESSCSRYRYLTNGISSENHSALRSIGISEPLRHVTTDHIRVLSYSDNKTNKSLNKSVQVSTTIQRCDRCTELSLLRISDRKLSTTSTSQLSTADHSSSCDDDDTTEFPARNLDQIRQRRATLVAKTIINQLATQPRSASIDRLISPLTSPSNQRHRSAPTTPILVRYSVKVSRSPSFETSHTSEQHQKEFSEVSNQISSLLILKDSES